MNPEYFFVIANIIFTCGTLLLFKQVVKNRNVLKDFDQTGSILTVLALCFMGCGYAVAIMYVGLLFMLPTLVFWIFVSYYTIQK